MTQIIICCTCHKERNLEDFHKDKQRKTGISPRCRFCVKEYQTANKERIKANAREWQLANPERVKQHLEKYQLKKFPNRKPLPKLSQEERIAKDKERRRLYREKNNEILYAKKKEYYKNNLEKRRLANHKRRALKLENGHTPYTEKQILDMYGTDCHICGVAIDLTASRKAGVGDWENGLHMDHVIDLASGGPDSINNIKPAHALCNLRKKPMLS